MTLSKTSSLSTKTSALVQHDCMSLCRWPPLSWGPTTHLVLAPEVFCYRHPQLVSAVALCIRPRTVPPQTPTLGRTLYCGGCRSRIPSHANLFRLTIRREPSATRISNWRVACCTATLPPKRLTSANEPSFPRQITLRHCIGNEKDPSRPMAPRPICFEPKLSTNVITATSSCTITLMALSIKWQMTRLVCIICLTKNFSLIFTLPILSRAPGDCGRRRRESLPP